MFAKIKKLGVAYVAFGFGTIFGSIIASIVGTLMFNVATGSIHAAEILKITECLEEKGE